MPAEAWPAPGKHASPQLCHLQQEPLGSRLWSPPANLKAVCVAANPTACGSRSGFVDKAWNGFSLSFYTKGQAVAFTLCNKVASAFATSIFNLSISRGLLR